MTRKRQTQIKQVWFTAMDEERFERVAKRLEAEGHDVEPDTKKALSPYSHTKVVRILLEQADK